MSDTIRLGFVGAGHMGQVAHLANYAKLPGVEIVAVAEGRPELAKKVATTYGILKVFADHRELLEKSDVQAVIAIMGFQFHHAVVPDILNASKHLLTEKSICVRPEKGREMAALAEKHNLTYQVGYMKRCDPGTRVVKKQADAWRASGDAGALRYVRCTAAMSDWIWGHEGPLRTAESFPAYEGERPEAPPAWMNEGQGKAYIAFINFWSHQVNLMRHLIGENYEWKYISPCGVQAIAESESGVPITFELRTNTMGQQWQERFTLSFDKGELELDLSAPLRRQDPGRVRISTEGEGGPVHQHPSTGNAWAFAEQARLFVEAIREGKPVVAPAADAVRDLELSERFIRLWAQ